jgi:diguanylate cyclase (GGDEF)-like protein
MRDPRWPLGAVALAAIIAAMVMTDIELAWRLGVLVIGVACASVAWRHNQLRTVFAIVMVVTTVRLTLFGTGQAPLTIRDSTWWQAGSDLIAGPALISVLLLAIKARRGRLDIRDALNGVMVTLTAGLAAWILIANPAWVDGVAPSLAVATALYLPIAFLLFTFALDLFLEGLTSNRAMWLAMGSATGNLAATFVRSFGRHTDADATALRIVAALFVVSFLLACFAIIHPDAPAAFRRVETDHHTASREVFRIAPLSVSLLTLACVQSLVDATSDADRAVRAIAACAIAFTTLTRLIVAFQITNGVQDRLLHRLHHDDLTALLSRSRFNALVDDELEATWRSESHVALIQVNIDRFKNLNDTLGHDGADRVLVQVADRLRDVADRWGGVVTRTGGDEFVILGGTVAAGDDACERAAAVAAALAAPVRASDTTVFVTASIGVAIAPRSQTVSADELMRRAHIATHRAKFEGRNRIVLFDESMIAAVEHRMEIESALHRAIDNNELRLYHQPVVDIVTGRLAGFEALIRWQRADGTVLAPAQFVPIAEETGLIVELGEWALVEALTDLRRWLDDGVIDGVVDGRADSPVTMSVNVSPLQLATPGFVDTVRSALRRSQVPAHLLWLELTESTMLDSPELAATTLSAIRSMGVRIALDDFGTGYSSLSLLQQFPIDRIKIDRAFVQGIAERTSDRSLVRTIVAMAQAMELDLVAEGVETVEQLQHLRNLGCALAQGYLISRPVPADGIRSTIGALGTLGSLPLFAPPEASLAVSRARRSIDTITVTPALRPLGASATHVLH